MQWAIFILCVAVAAPRCCSGQQWQTATSLPFEGLDEYELASVLYDSATNTETFCWNNNYPLVSFVVIGTTTLDFIGGADILWARYSLTTLTWSWAMIGGGTRAEIVLDAQLLSNTLGGVSTSSDVIAALTTTSTTVTFGGFVLANPNSSGLQSVVVMRISGSTGAVLWAQIGGASNTVGCSITRMTLSSSLVGVILAPTNYASPSTTVTMAGQTWTVYSGNVFTALLLSTGAYYTALIGDCSLGYGSYVMTDAASDGAGAVFISGYYAQNGGAACFFSGVSLISTASFATSIVMRCATSTGVCAYMTGPTAGSDGSNYMTGVSVDSPTGTVVFLGYFQSTSLNIDGWSVSHTHPPPAATNADYVALFVSAATFAVGGIQSGGGAGDDVPAPRVYAWSSGGGLLTAVHTFSASIVFPSEEYGTVSYAGAGQQDAVVLEFLTRAPFTPWTVMGFGGPLMDTVTGVIYNAMDWPCVVGTFSSPTMVAGSLSVANFASSTSNPTADWFALQINPLVDTFSYLVHGGGVGPDTTVGPLTVNGAAVVVGGSFTGNGQFGVSSIASLNSGQVGVAYVMLQPCAVNSAYSPTGVCSCLAGTTGNGLVCAAIAYCGTNNGGCSQFAQCTEPSIYPATGPTCACFAGYQGDGFTCLPQLPSSSSAASSSDAADSSSSGTAASSSAHISSTAAANPMSSSSSTGDYSRVFSAASSRRDIMSAAAAIALQLAALAALAALT